MFEFRDPGWLVDGDLELVLVEQYPGDPLTNRVPAYKFEMRRAGQLQDIGHIQLRVGNTRHIVMYAGHVGYGINPEHRGHGYAARACTLLLPLALDHGLTTLWMTCDPDNIPSRKTLEALGANFVEVVDLPRNTDMYERGGRRVFRYRLDIAAE